MKRRLPGTLILILILLYCGFAQRAEGRTAGYLPKRVVSLAPHITEIVFKLEKGNLLVARTDFCNFPKAAQTLPSIGAYLNLNLEYLVSLQPDIIFDFPNSQYRSKLEELGIPVMDVPNETVEEILSSIIKVGNILGAEERAMRVVQGIRDTLNLVGKDLAAAVRPKAMLVVGRQAGSLDGLTVAGPQTYLSEIWQICGGENAFSKAPARYFSPSMEALYTIPVDIIMEFYPATNQIDIEKCKLTWQKLTQLNAVKNNHVMVFCNSAFLIPGPRITRVAMEFRRTLIKWYQWHQGNKK